MADDLPPVTFGVKVIRDDGPGGHVHFDLFAGRTPAARGRSGRLVLRADEYEEFVARLSPEAIAPRPVAAHFHGPLMCRIQDHESGSENTNG